MREGLRALWFGMFSPPPPIGALVVSDPERRFGLWRAPVVEVDTGRIYAWGHLRRSPIQAEVSAMVALRLIREEQNRRWRDDR